MAVLTTQLLVVVAGADREETRARTPATSVEKPDTGLASANLPSRMDPPNQPRHPRVSSMLVAMSNQQLDGGSPKLRKPSLVGTRSTNGAQSAVVEKDAMFVIMSQLTTTPGGLRCRPNANRSKTSKRQLQPLRASWMLLRPTMIGRLSDTPADI